MDYRTIYNYNDQFAAGWTSNDFLLEPYTNQYYNSSWQRDHNPPINMPDLYNTDILTKKSLAYLDKASQGYIAGIPFFLTFAPIVPHSNVIY